MLMELGRLTFEVKVNDVGEGKKVLNNRIAIQAGKDKTTFIDIVAWNGTAELIGKYFKKGYEILIEGHLINTSKKKDNVEYETVEILVENVLFTHGKPADVPDFLK